MKWRLIRSGMGSPAWNMAVDESLLRLSKAPLLRLYEWDRSAVSIGYFQSTSVVPAGREFVRRYTGGGLVDHLADVTYTVILPKGDPILALSTTESYRQIHEAVAKSLQFLKVEAILAPCCDPEEKDACFQRAVKYDVVLGNEKLAGAAQRRTREGMLQQGSVLISKDQLRTDFRSRFPQDFSDLFHIQFEESELTLEEIDRAKALEQSRYGTAEWNHQK
ncbi:MAG: biotin/lipoate A/B protein ligase family protein [Verrucomicrobiota bacterium]